MNEAVAGMEATKSNGQFSAYGLCYDLFRRWKGQCYFMAVQCFQRMRSACVCMWDIPKNEIQQQMNGVCICEYEAADWFDFQKCQLVLAKWTSTEVDAAIGIATPSSCIAEVCTTAVDKRCVCKICQTYLATS